MALFCSQTFPISYLVYIGYHMCTFWILTYQSSIVPTFEKNSYEIYFWNILKKTWITSIIYLRYIADTIWLILQYEYASTPWCQKKDIKKLFPIDTR